MTPEQRRNKEIDDAVEALRRQLGLKPWEQHIADVKLQCRAEQGKLAAEDQIDLYRRTGRTLRMQLYAVVVSRTRHVVLIAHTEDYARRLRVETRELAAQVGADTEQLARIEALSLPRVEDHHQRGRGPDWVYLEDHYVVEDLAHKMRRAAQRERYEEAKRGP